MKIILVFAGVAYLLAPIATYFAGRRIAFNSSVRTSLSALGLTQYSVSRYLDAMKLLNAIVNSADLDGPYVGNVLTQATEREASRLVNGYRKDLGL